MLWDVALHVRYESVVEGGTPRRIYITSKMWTYYNSNGNRYDIVFDEWVFDISRDLSKCKDLDDIAKSIIDYIYEWVVKYTPTKTPGLTAYRATACAIKPTRVTVRNGMSTDYFGTNYMISSHVPQEFV